MAIKRYLEFIKESYDEFESIGEWVESLYQDDYIKNIVNRYIGEITSDIRLANAINLLDEMDQKDLKQQIEKYQEDGIEEKEPIVLTSTDLEPLTESEITKAGRGIFHSFLKTLTALGQKEKTANTERCPDDFLLFYFYENLDSMSVRQIFGRFQSLVPYLEHIDYGQNETNLYFGIKCDGELEYGAFYENTIPFGGFKLNQTAIKWINNIDAKSAFSLKKELVNLSYSNILTLGKIKSDMTQYNPGYHEKKLKPELRDRVISFGYQGIGKWDNGKLDEAELMNIKNNFVTWLLSKSWGGKVLISVKPGSYWLYIHLKLK
jgi:hypothetical protein